MRQKLILLLCWRLGENLHTPDLRIWSVDHERGLCRWCHLHQPFLWFSAGEKGSEVQWAHSSSYDNSRATLYSPSQPSIAAAILLHCLCSSCSFFIYDQYLYLSRAPDAKQGTNWSLDFGGDCPPLEIFLGGIFHSKGGLSHLPCNFFEGDVLWCHNKNQLVKCKKLSVVFIYFNRQRKCRGQDYNLCWWSTLKKNPGELHHLPLVQSTLLATCWSMCQQ